jgi:hypothetical protein
VRNAAPVTVIRITSAIGKQIEKKVETKFPSKCGSTGLMTNAVRRELKPKPIIELSNISRKVIFLSGSTNLGKPIRAKG